MPSTRLIAITARDRAAVERLIDALQGDRRAGLPLELAALPGDSVFCVQRYPAFLEDHSIVDNWALPLWTRDGLEPEEWEWLLAEASARFATYSDRPVEAFPGELDEIAKIAAQFVQAQLMMPEVLLLDGVLSAWHRSDAERIGVMLDDFVRRYPLRWVLHVDIAEPPPGIASFRCMELSCP